MPLVSIGMPVYNGRAYMREAIESLLAQTLRDFELIISDNASTDQTPDICQEYAARDDRVRVVRQPHNIGAAPNFNAIMPHATGRYFRWHAHDDKCAPEYLERCVDVLEADPEVVLAYPQTMLIDSGGTQIQLDPFILLADDPSPAERFRETLRGHGCYEVFGLIRMDRLRQTRLIGNYAHGDGVLLAELALRGRLREIGEPLFLSRSHADHSMAMVLDYHAYAAWFDPKNAGRLVFPCWRILREYLRAVNRAPIGFAQRRRCYRVIAGWCLEWRKRLRGDLTFAVRKTLGIRRKPPNGVTQPSETPPKASEIG
jgi:glycosyltransferase involved in cell wall biosynthesis